MIRWVRVIEQSADSITLKLQATQACEGCPKNCNRPLFNLFKAKDNQFTLEADATEVEFTNPEKLFSEQHPSDALLGLQIDQASLLNQSMGFYGLPLVLIILMMTAGHGLALILGQSSDFWTLSGFLAGLFVASLVLKGLKSSPKVTILSAKGTSFASAGL